MPIGLILGCSTNVASAFKTFEKVLSTLSTVKPISIAKGLLATLLSIKPFNKLVLANSIAAKDNVV